MSSEAMPNQLLRTPMDYQNMATMSETAGIKLGLRSRQATFDDYDENAGGKLPQVFRSSDAG